MGASSRRRSRARSHGSVAIAAWLLVALTPAGCKPPPGPGLGSDPPALSAKPYPGAHALEASLQNGWITVTVSLPNRPDGPKPVVISPIVDDRVLLERGIGVVRFRTHWEQLRAFNPNRAASATNAAKPPAPTTEPAPQAVVEQANASAPAAAPAAAAPAAPSPAAGGGGSVGVWLLAAPRPGIVGQAYFEIISVDALDSVPKVVDFLLQMPQVDPTRISIAGSSTSGFVALEALAAEPRLAGGVVRVACGDYFLFLRDSSLALGGNPSYITDGKPDLDPAYAEHLRQIEPIRHVDRFPPRPLLLMAGDADRAIPVQCVERTAAALTKAYAAAGVPDRFRLVLFPGEGHNLGDESARTALSWWSRWLLGQANAPRGAAP